MNIIWNFHKKIMMSKEKIQRFITINFEQEKSLNFNELGELQSKLGILRYKSLNAVPLHLYQKADCL